MLLQDVITGILKRVIRLKKPEILHGLQNGFVAGIKGA